MELIVLGVVASLGFASWFLWKRARTGQQQAPTDAGIKGQLSDGERTLHNIQVGDVVSHLGTDYMVEGVLTLDEDGQVTRIYRMADGLAVRWLGARPGDDAAMLLEEAPELALDANGPEDLHHAGVPYRLKARGSAAVLRSGNLGAPRPAERARVYEYAGAGSARIFAIAWPERVDAYRGERLSPQSVDILPGR